METTELFNRLKNVLVDYYIAKFCDHNITTYFTEAEILLPEIDSKNLDNEFVNYLDFHDCTKLSLFLHDFCCYQQKRRNLLVGADDDNVGDDFNNINMDRVLNNIENLPHDLSDFNDLNVPIRGNAEEVFDTGEFPVIREVNRTELTSESELETPKLQLLLENNSDANNRSSLSWQRSLIPLCQAPSLTEWNLPDLLLEPEEEQFLPESVIRLRNLQNVLIQRNINNYQNGRTSQNDNTLLNVIRRTTHTPRITSIQPRRIHRRHISVPQPPRRRHNLFIKDFTSATINLDDNDFNERYIASFKEREYVKILEFSNIEIDFTNVGQFQNHFTNNEALEFENINERNSISSHENKLFQDPSPISVPSLYRSYTPNIRTNQNSATVLDSRQNLVINPDSRDEIINTISTKAFYGPKMSTIHESIERRLSTGGVDDINMHQNISNPRTLSLEDEVNRNRYLEMLRVRPINGNNGYAEFGHSFNRRNRRRRRRRINNIRENFGIQDFKNFQAEFLRYNGQNYESLPKFELDCYTDLYDPEEFQSFINVFKLLITSHNKPVLKNILFPFEMPQREINLRRNTIKSLTDLQIVEILNNSDVEEDMEVDDNISAIQFKISTVSNDFLTKIH